jgi:hypothetical protein
MITLSVMKEVNSINAPINIYGSEMKNNYSESYNHDNKAFHFY